jgi:sugar phosphate isomerase/epimerase
MPFRLAAFGDEISTDIHVQVEHLRKHNIRWCGMRGAFGLPVLELSDAQVAQTKDLFDKHGIQVYCIGSPVAKAPIDGPLKSELSRLKKAAALARRFETGVIRIFSFEAPSPGAPGVRNEVLSRMKAIADLATDEGVSLEIENGPGMYGDVGTRLREILSHINSPHVRQVFDFGSFVTAGEDPLNAWQLLRQWVDNFQIKDNKKGQAKAVMIGKGDGRAKEILQDAFATGWTGTLTVEPHLGTHPTYKWYSGPELFDQAMMALTRLLEQIDAR